MTWKYKGKWTYHVTNIQTYVNLWRVLSKKLLYLVWTSIAFKHQSFWFKNEDGEFLLLSIHGIQWPEDNCPRINVQAQFLCLWTFSFQIWGDSVVVWTYLFFKTAYCYSSNSKSSFIWLYSPNLDYCIGGSNYGIYSESESQTLLFTNIQNCVNFVKLFLQKWIILFGMGIHFP